MSSTETVTETDPDTADIRLGLRSLQPLSVSSPQALIGRGVQFLLGISGSIALIMIIIGGLTMMFAGGKGDRIKQGSKIVVWASIGLITMILSYALVSFVVGSII